MGKEAKTNAMRILERAKVAYTAHEYPHEEGVAVDGVTVAASMGEDPACGQLMRAYEQFGSGVVGVKEVSREAIRKYSSLKVEHIQDNYFRCTDMVEKPQPGQEFSLYSILGRCVLPPEIFDILDNTPPGAGGEIQLTDAMATLARRDGMTAVDFTGTRYDMGNKLGIMQASVEVALRHPEIGEDFRAYLKELCKTL